MVAYNADGESQPSVSISVITRSTESVHPTNITVPANLTGIRVVSVVTRTHVEISILDMLTMFGKDTCSLLVQILADFTTFEQLYKGTFLILTPVLMFCTSE